MKHLTNSLPLSQFLANTAMAMAATEQRAQALDLAVADMIAREPRRSTKELSMILQDVDLLRQEIACLTMVVQNASQEATGCDQVDTDAVLEGVYLDAVRTRCLSQHDTTALDGTPTVEDARIKNAF